VKKDFLFINSKITSFFITFLSSTSFNYANTPNLFYQRIGICFFKLHNPKQNLNFIILKQMKETEKHNERIAKMTFASVYPHYVTKVQTKGRTVKELHQVIEWLTGFDEKKLQKLIDEKATFETFFYKAKLNPNAQLITGVICGYRIEEIENPLTKQARYLDKLIDELAKGKKMEKILRH